MVIISWVKILRLQFLKLLCFFASLFLLLRAHFPPILQDFYDFVPLPCPFFDLIEFSVSSLPLLIPKSLAAPFKHQTCQSQPDCHISEPWAEPNPKSDLKPPFHTNVSCPDWFGKLCSICCSSVFCSVWISLSVVNIQKYWNAPWNL